MSDDPVERLWRAARRLRAGRKAAGDRLPPLLFFTDPDRTPSPETVMKRLPRGAGVVFRPFGRPQVLAIGPALARLARERGLIFLVGADVRLALALRADGVHLPERSLRRVDRRNLPAGFIVTAAGHGLIAALRAKRAGVDAIVTSPIFPSASPSAARPIGAMALAALVRRTATPIYALGGINARTVARLSGSPLAGIAAIEGFSAAYRTKRRDAVRGLGGKEPACDRSVVATGSGRVS